MGGKSSAITIEPIKGAAATMRDASLATTRAQQLRRGIASTFSRHGIGTQAAVATSATAGAATKLGG